METNTIHENNLLIAQFMGLVDLEKDLGHYYLEHEEDEDIQFHSDWRVLMPVVEKINWLDNEKYAISINSDRVFLHSPNHRAEMFMFEKGKCIEATYKAVVEFIQWYNLNK